MTYGPLAKALDNLQICPPRTDTQRAIAWAMHDVRQRDWRQEVALELRERRRAFTKAMQTPVVRDGASASVGVGAQGEKSKGGRDAKSPEELGWRIESEGNFGAYYVYVRHPFEGTPSETVAAGLAGLVGVVVLPGE